MGFLDNLKIESWYMLLLYVGIFGTLCTIFIPLQGFDKAAILPLFLGVSFVGIGEWKRERFHHSIKPPNVYTGGTALITQKIQVKDPFGIILDIIGVVLIILGVYRILF